MRAWQDERRTIDDSAHWNDNMTSRISLNDSNTNFADKTPIVALEEALNHVATATAALLRAGPLYRSYSEPLWHFAAGSWSRPYYRYAVYEATKQLPKTIGVEKDVSLAREKLHSAVALLRVFGDERDADDLEEAAEQVLYNVG